MFCFLVDRPQSTVDRGLYKEASPKKESPAWIHSGFSQGFVEFVIDGKLSEVIDIYKFLSKFNLFFASN
jgi:hypothetical protein